MRRVSHRQTGVVLGIVLQLLLILTLLAVTSLHGAGNELALAANEKLRQHAAAAAEIGVEAGFAALPAATLDGGAHTTELAIAPDEPQSEDRARIVTRHHGTVTLVPGFSSGRFVGRAFEIRSTGSSARGARAERVQGALRIDAADAAFAPLPEAQR
jgi:hypothetical protein